MFCHVNVLVTATVGRCHTCTPCRQAGVNQPTYCTDVDEKYLGTPNYAVRMNTGRRRDQSNPGTRSPAYYQVATGVLQRAARGSKLPEFWKSTRVPVLVVVQSCWNLILQGFNDRLPSNRLPAGASRIFPIARFRS